MEEQKASTADQVLWHKKNIIRKKSTKEPFLVLHVYQYMATLVISLTDKSELPLLRVLLPREYDEYSVDDAASED